MNTLEDLEILCEDETREEFGVQKIRDSYANLRRSRKFGKFTRIASDC